MPNIVSAPVTQVNLLQPLFDLDVPKNLNEKIDDRRLRDALAVSPLQFLVFGYLDQYLTFFDVAHFHCMGTDGNEWKVPDHLRELLDTDFTGWVMKRNHLVGHGTLDCRIV